CAKNNCKNASASAFGSWMSP
ncbi:MAG: hypothetical protein, partial [Olavius algarvensis Gamma 1 endosymbiont]